MRQLRFRVATSLDGFIAGPKGEYDWIVHDPAFDFGALSRQARYSMRMKTVVVSRRFN